MRALSTALHTEQQPPMAIPLRHFVVGAGFLLLGSLVGVVVVLDIAPGAGALVHVHLLLVGWICITIMGAVTQFVPVWSGVSLHSRRLSVVQLWLVTVGVLGFVASLTLGRFSWLPPFGAAMALGFWAFAYNVARTLSACSAYDSTERHFLVALGFFLLVPAMGLLLAVDFVSPIFVSLPVSRMDVVQTHATLAVFGAIGTTIMGAFYQLITMFTQTEHHGTGSLLRRVEEVGYPTGVVLLASGRLLDSEPAATIGGVLVVGSVIGFGAILARRLSETRVAWTPTLSRYAVATAMLPLWAGPTLVAWIENPLSRAVRFGAPGTAHVLAVGVVGFVVLGTLYHVVPFVVWVHRYSDRLGYDAVPMVDDLYDDRLAVADFGCLLGGTGVLLAADWLGLAPAATTGGGLLVLVGTVLFLSNVLFVIRAHSPQSVVGVLFTTFATDPETTTMDPSRDP